MKRSLFSMFAVFLIQTTYAQISLNIDTLALSHYKVIFNKYDIREDDREGPWVDFDCTIKNISKDTILLKPSGSKKYVLYRYKGEDFSSELFSFTFSEKDTLILLPDQKVNIGFGDFILLGTKILKHTQGDYTKEMLEILPTIKIKYKDDNYSFTSEAINNVKINK